MKKKLKILLNKEQLSRTIDRLCYQLIEHHNHFSDSCIIGIQNKGVLLAKRIQNRIEEIENIDNIPYGKLDITFLEMTSKLLIKFQILPAQKLIS